nr:MAG TPA: hypothetical protein [Caudoviricetes sp.]
MEQENNILDGCKRLIMKLNFHQEKLTKGV